MSDEHLSDAIFAASPDGGAHPDDRGRQDDPRDSDRDVRPPHRRRRGPALVLAGLALVVASIVAAVLVLKPMVDGFLGNVDYSASDTTGKEVSITVHDKDNGAAIGQTLADADVVKSTKAFTKAAKDDARSASIQPGTYLMKQHIPAKDAVAYLVDPAHRVVRRVTVTEGMRATDVYAALAKVTGTPAAEYAKAAKDTAGLGLPAAAKGNVEGYLFPSTYELAPKSTPVQQLAQMVAKAKQVTTELGIPADRLERTMTMASIVESESRLDADRGKVARVLENRLTKGMRLQLDSTVAYATGKRVITTTDAERAQVNGYNTYTRDGLPVGPIGNPGEASIKAAAGPTPGSWLYFVTVDPATGETVFTDSFAEHQAAVARFQQWCQAHTGQC